MNDAYAASWLDLALEDAKENVRRAEHDVKDKRFLLSLAQGQLDRATAQVDAIRLIISRSSLITSQLRVVVPE